MRTHSPLDEPRLRLRSIDPDELDEPRRRIARLDRALYPDPQHLVAPAADDPTTSSGVDR